MSPLCFLTMAMAVFLPGDKFRTQVREEEKLQGYWQIHEAEVKGQTLEEQQLGEMRQWRIIFEGKRCAVRFSDGSQKESAVYLAKVGKLNSIDLVGRTGPDQGIVSKGIWRIEGEHLRWCYNNKPGDDRRPKRFETTPDSEFIMVVLKRLDASVGKN
jgi:uncharacterized protein (TIGR03067 family)